MVSKYARDGRLVISILGKVAAKASLHSLEGSLNEDKRRAALTKLGVVGIPETQSVFKSD